MLINNENRMISLIQRAIIALCLIFLFACSSPACRQWEIQDVITTHSAFNGGRLILESDNDYSRLEVEVVRNCSGIRFYINLLLLEAPPCKEDPGRTRIEIHFDNQDPWILYPYLMGGNQRFLLPGDAADALIQSLLDEQSFTIYIGRSLITVVPTNFSKVYRQLLALPIENYVPN
jgi:hypothetical protein